MPWRGVRVAAIGDGTGIFGVGATTGVASLRMFLGAEPPCFSFGFGCCFCLGGGGGGGGGGRGGFTSNTRSTLCSAASGSWPDMCSNAKSNAA